jgi:hypothetical protein
MSSPNSMLRGAAKSAQHLTAKAAAVNAKPSQKPGPDGLRNEKELFLHSCVDNIQLMCRIYGYRGAASYDEHVLRRNAVERWSEISDACAPGLAGCIKFMKWKLAAFKSIGTEQVLPAVPWKGTVLRTDNPGCLLGGRYYHFVRAMLKKPLAEKLSFIDSIAKLKKGLPRPNKDMLRAAEKQTFDELTAESKSPLEVEVVSPHPPFIERHPLAARSTKRTLGRLDIQREIERAVQELFPRHGYSLKDRLNPFFPSTSANYIRSRKDLGAVGALQEDHKDLFEGLKLSSGGIQQRWVKEEESIGANRDPVRVFDDGPLRENFARFYTRLIDKAVDEQPLAEPLALAEALKVRVITKGPPLLATAMKPLQRFLWKTLASHRCFQLIGKPVDNRVLLDVLGKLRPNEKFNSGDYANATNELSSWVSEMIATTLSVRLGLTENERVLFMRSLTRHDIVHGSDVAPQKNGQLMGSVTSFPVLCIANFVLCRLAMESGCGHRIPANQLRLLVNGDDCVFPSTPLVVANWERLGQLFGLKPSIGKCFLSADFLEINSTCFLIVPPFVQLWPQRKTDLPTAPLAGQSVVVRRNHFEPVEFVNTGLMLGMKRSGKIDLKDVTDPVASLGTLHRELHATCPQALWSVVHREFLKHHDDVLKKCRVPWYLPESLGGLGLYGTQSSTDLRLINSAILRWGELNRHPVSMRADTPWTVRKTALRQFDGLQKELLTPQQASDFETVVGKCCAATMFDVAVTMDDLYCSEMETSKHTLRENEKFWEYLFREANYKALPDVPDKVISLDPSVTREEYFTRALFAYVPPTVGPVVTAATRDMGSDVAKVMKNEEHYSTPDQFRSLQVRHLIRSVHEASTGKATTFGVVIPETLGSLEAAKPEAVLGEEESKIVQQFWVEKHTIPFVESMHFAPWTSEKERKTFLFEQRAQAEVHLFRSGIKWSDYDSDDEKTELAPQEQKSHPLSLEATKDDCGDVKIETKTSVPVYPQVTINRNFAMPKVTWSERKTAQPELSFKVQKAIDDYKSLHNQYMRLTKVPRGMDPADHVLTRSEAQDLRLMRAEMDRCRVIFKPHWMPPFQLDQYRRANVQHRF